MKLLKLILVVVSAFFLSFLFSNLLGFDWVQRFIARQILVYLLMAIPILVGYLILVELLTDRKSSTGQ